MGALPSSTLYVEHGGYGKDENMAITNLLWRIRGIYDKDAHTKIYYCHENNCEGHLHLKFDTRHQQIRVCQTRTGLTKAYIVI